MFSVLVFKSFDTIAGIIFKGNVHGLGFVNIPYILNKTQTVNITLENDT